MDADEHAGKAADVAYGLVSGVLGGALVFALTFAVNFPCGTSVLGTPLEPCRNVFGSTPLVIEGSPLAPYVLGFLAAGITYGVVYLWHWRSGSS
ncbi:hypothetical protein [Cellulosimicrobium arenosum]|uniref:Uncharacterized protein n=1 Tax=Cellulosimicrobium arenosum TaxID=2708133 RepID=A0A927PFM2_9MICO|nr:hypothetical protein [Cellulosimicrobium arenosum]MBD8079820.1 hypothetical protein [Cellulosimicrobium arenosum]